MPLHTPAAVLFDFDSTLVDTEPLWIESELALATAHGIAWSEADSHAHVGKSIPTLCAAMAARSDDPELTWEQLSDELVETQVAKCVAKGGDLFRPGARELVEQVREAGIPHALVSSSYRHIIDAILETLPDMGFGAIVGGDEVEHNKPHPYPYEHAARLLGVDATECLVIEDSVSGSHSGQAAGAVVLTIPAIVEIHAEPGRVVLPTLAGVGVDDLSRIFSTERERVNTLSGVRTGPLRAGERVTLTDPKGRRHSILLTPGKGFQTTKGGFSHDDLIGRPQGITATTKQGLTFLVMRPLMSDYMVAMPREAAVIYPKDAAQIIMWADIFPGARVLEAGVGSGALSIAMLRAIGETGRLHSYERREEFAEVAQRNVENFLGGKHPSWEVTVGDLVESISDEPIDRAVLDMLAPWECVDAVGERMVPGGVLCCYVATTTQMGRVMDTLRVHGGWTEPMATETIVRDWHAEGLSVRPGHGSSGHTGFLVITRRLAPGVEAPMRKRRPAPGAYGPDYHGPRPKNIPMTNQDVPVEVEQAADDATGAETTEALNQ